MTLENKPVWLWLDEDPLSSKLAELLSLGNGPAYYTWNPTQDFTHLIDSMEFEGVIIHDTKSTFDQDHFLTWWKENGLRKLWNTKENNKVIIWGYKWVRTNEYVERNFGTKVQFFYWPQASLNPLTFDNDRHVLLNQSKSGQ